MTMRWRDLRPEAHQHLRILGFVILGAGLFYLFGLIIFGSEVQSDSDVLFYYYPVKSAIRSLWLNHHSLIWNPFLGEGQPLAGNPEHELFYPFTWLIFLMPVARASAITLGVHFIAGWLGMRRLLGRLGCSEGGAILGAVAWGFGGAWISSTHFLPVFLAWTWIPWLAAGAAEGSSTFRGAVRDSLFGALILLIGEPVTALTGALAYFAVLFWNPVTKERFRKALVTAVFSIAIAAATLFPGAALARKSLRAVGIDDAVAEKKSFPVARIVEFIGPRMTGNVVPHMDRDYFGWRLYPEKGWPFYAGIYAGVLFLPLVLAGVLAEFRRSRALQLIAAGAFVLALGSAGGLWRVLRQILPFWRGVRYPEKFLALVIFLTVILMALGFDAVGRSARLSRFVAVWLVAVGLVLGTAAASPRLWMPFLGQLLRDSQNVFQAVFVRAAIAHLTFAVFFLLPVRLRRRDVVVASFLALAAVDVLSSSHDFIRTHSVAQMEAKPPVVTALEQLNPRPMPRVVDLLPDDPPVPVPGADELNGPWDRNRVVGEQLVQWGIPLALDIDYDLTYIAATDRARRLLSRIAAVDTDEFGELLAQRSACAFLLWKRPPTLDDPVVIAGIRGCRPEVDAATAILSFSGDDDFLKMARENKGRLARSVIVEDASPSAARPVNEAVLSELSSRTNALSFQAECPSSCYVRVARTNDGHWKAFLDGRPLATNTVDISLIGVPIPAGAHRIDLRYSDGVLRTSIGISVVAFLVAIAILVSGVVARRSQPSSA
jgi:hypothetical protein